MGKQVKTPRFYVDMPTFLHATGSLNWADTIRGGADLLYMNCANPFTRIDENYKLFTLGATSGSSATTKTSFPINFCALLNHNLGSANSSIHIGAFKGIGGVSDNSFFRLHSSSPSHAAGWTNVINCGGNGNYNAGLGAEYNGTSMWTFNTIDDYWYNFYVSSLVFEQDDPNTEEDESGTSYIIPNEDLGLNHQLGSFVVGKYFDCPNSPDLNLTMSRRFDGIKSQKTIGGKTLSNIYYDGPTEWTMNGPNGTYKYPPFELDFPEISTAYDYADDPLTPDIDESNLEQVKKDFNQISKSGLGRKGLRSWKLSFSYIAESDMWIEHEVSNNVISDSETPDVTKPSPMLSDNSFNFVWNCTLGGTLPFIFQPDNTNNNPDQFSICTFRENTFSVQQQAHNVYKVSMTIDELA